jgi:hypothetical protein
VDDLPALRRAPGALHVALHGVPAPDAFREALALGGARRGHDPGGASRALGACAVAALLFVLGCSAAAASTPRAA